MSGGDIGGQAEDPSDSVKRLRRNLKSLYCVYSRGIIPGTVWYGTVRCGTRVFTLFRAIPYSVK